MWNDAEDPTAGYTYTDSLTIDASSAGSFSVNQINAASLASANASGTSLDGIDFSLASVVVSITLDVPAYDQGWQFQGTVEGMTGLYVQNMEAAVTYSLQISPAGGDPMLLSATSSMGPVSGFINDQYDYTNPDNPQLVQGISPAAMAAAASSPQKFTINTFPENSSDPIATYNYNTLQSDVTYNADINNPDEGLILVEALANNPGVRLKVTITYNVVPEPGVLSLLVVGSAFLLRRRKFRLA